MSFRHWAHSPIIFASCAFIFMEFALLIDQNHQCRPSERYVTHSSRWIPIFTFPMLAAQKPRLIKQFQFFFGINLWQINESIKPCKLMNLKRWGHMDQCTTAIFECKNCFAIKCSVLLNTYVYILYRQIKIYTKCTHMAQCVVRSLQSCSAIQSHFLLTLQ